MTVAHLDRVRTILLLALAGIIAVAFLARLDFLIIRGGLQADQLEWAARNYGGGLTLEYLKIRNAHPVVDAGAAAVGLSPRVCGSPGNSL